LRRGGHPGGEDRDLLQRRRQRSHDLHPCNRQQLADLLDAELRLAAGDELADGDAGFGDDELGLHFGGNSQPLQDAWKVDAALAALGMGDRARREQRAAQCFRRANLGLARALAHRNPDAGAGKIDPAAGDRLAARNEIIDRLGRENGEIGIGTAGDIAGKPYCRAPDHGDRRCALALERGRKIEHHRFEAVGAENLHGKPPP